VKNSAVLFATLEPEFRTENPKKRPNYGFGAAFWSAVSAMLPP
jgi:hypothetical protein